MARRAQFSSDLISSLERVVDSGASMIAATDRSLQDVVGPRPFGKEKLSERDQVVRYGLVRDDPQAWATLIKEHGPAAAIRYAQRLEDMRQHYPEEAGYFEAPSAGSPLSPQPPSPQPTIAPVPSPEGTPPWSVSSKA